MPSKSVRQLITEDILTTLEGITTEIPEGEDEAEYFNDIQEVIPISTLGDGPKQYPAIVVVPEEEQAEQIPMDRWSKVLVFTLQVWAKEYITGQIVEQVNGLLADIEKAILKDPQRGEQAIDTTLLGNTAHYNSTVKPYVGIDIRIAVRYRHAFGDPAVIR